MRIYIALLLSIISIAANAQKCPKLKVTDLPAKDRPPISFNLSQLKDTVSTSYYYGLGVKADFKMARYLAFKEMSAGSESVLEGANILLMLYANGYGVKRDLPLSIRLACGNVGWAPMEVEGRDNHLKAMLAGDTSAVFDICDDITSGYMMGFCRSITTERNEYARNTAIDLLVREWPAKDLAAYRTLRMAATNFFDARCGSEVDLSGTARAAFVLEESDALWDEFLVMLKKAGKCALPVHTTADHKKADDELNAVYKKVMATKQEDITLIANDGIKQTQRSWLTYRDAWVAFGKTRCPNIPEDTWLTILTESRVMQLRGLLQE